MARGQSRGGAVGEPGRCVLGRHEIVPKGGGNLILIKDYSRIAREPRGKLWIKVGNTTDPSIDYGYDALVPNYDKLRRDGKNIPEIEKGIAPSLTNDKLQKKDVKKKLTPQCEIHQAIAIFSNVFESSSTFS